MMCLDRLRAIGQASLVYSEKDRKNSAIPVHPAQLDPRFDDTAIGAYDWGGKSGVGWPEYRNGSNGLHSRYGTSTGFGPTTRPLNTIFYPHGFRDNLDRYTQAGAILDTELRLDAYRCPADDGPPLGGHCYHWVENPTRSSYDHFGTSYAANTFMVGTGSGAIMSNSPYLRALSGVSNPARTLSYEENIGRWAWACRREINDCTWIGSGVDPGPTKALRGWHGKDWTYNRAFVDAHAETQTIYNEGSEDADGYATHYRNEELDSYSIWPDCSTCDVGSTDCEGSPRSFDQYRCVIVRGDGWQKDTMPAPLTCTGQPVPSWGRPSYEYCVESEAATASTGGRPAGTARPVYPTCD